MPRENVIKFYEEVKNSEVLKKEFENLRNQVESGEETREESLAKKIVSIAKENGFDFTEKELLSYMYERTEALSDEDLLSVSGGVSARAVGVGLLGALMLSFASGAALTTSAASVQDYSSQITAVDVENGWSLGSDWDLNVKTKDNQKVDIKDDQDRSNFLQAVENKLTEKGKNKSWFSGNFSKEKLGNLKINGEENQYLSKIQDIEIENSWSWSSKWNLNVKLKTENKIDDIDNYEEFLDAIEMKMKQLGKNKSWFSGKFSRDKIGTLKVNGEIFTRASYEKMQNEKKAGSNTNVGSSNVKNDGEDLVKDNKEINETNEKPAGNTNENKDNKSQTNKEQSSEAKKVENYLKQVKDYDLNDKNTYTTTLFVDNFDTIKNETDETILTMVAKFKYGEKIEDLTDAETAAYTDKIVIKSSDKTNSELKTIDVKKAMGKISEDSQNQMNENLKNIDYNVVSECLKIRENNLREEEKNLQNLEETKEKIEKLSFKNVSISETGELTINLSSDMQGFNEENIIAIAVSKGKIKISDLKGSVKKYKIKYDNGKYLSKNFVFDEEINSKIEFYKGIKSTEKKIESIKKQIKSLRKEVEKANEKSVNINTSTNEGTQTTDQTANDVKQQQMQQVNQNVQQNIIWEYRGDWSGNNLDFKLADGTYRVGNIWTDKTNGYNWCVGIVKVSGDNKPQQINMNDMNTVLRKLGINQSQYDLNITLDGTSGLTIGNVNSQSVAYPRQQTQQANQAIQQQAQPQQQADQAKRQKAEKFLEGMTQKPEVKNGRVTLHFNDDDFKEIIKNKNADVLLVMVAKVIGSENVFYLSKDISEIMICCSNYSKSDNVTNCIKRGKSKSLVNEMNNVLKEVKYDASKLPSKEEKELENAKKELTELKASLEKMKKFKSEDNGFEWDRSDGGEVTVTAKDSCGLEDEDIIAICLANQLGIESCKITVGGKEINMEKPMQDREISLKMTYYENLGTSGNIGSVEEKENQIGKLEKAIKEKQGKNNSK